MFSHLDVGVVSVLRQLHIPIAYDMGTIEGI